jgi:hypothetical protein
MDDEHDGLPIFCEMAEHLANLAPGRQPAFWSREYQVRLEEKIKRLQFARAQ